LIILSQVSGSHFNGLMNRSCVARRHTFISYDMCSTVVAVTIDITKDRLFSRYERYRVLYVACRLSPKGGTLVQLLGNTYVPEVELDEGFRPWCQAVHTHEAHECHMICTRWV
jgi:hypothetical protein